MAHLHPLAITADDHTPFPNLKERRIGSMHKHSSEPGESACYGLGETASKGSLIFETAHKRIDSELLWVVHPIVGRHMQPASRRS
jgi:hypothetical protein